MRLTGKLLAMTFLIVAIPHVLLAQGRTGVYIRDPGSMNQIGSKSASSTFQYYSYGVGSLSRYSSASSDILRNSNPLNTLNAMSFKNSSYSLGGKAFANAPGVPGLMAPPTGTYTNRPGGAIGYGSPGVGRGPGALQALVKSFGKSASGEPMGAYLQAITTNPASRPSADDPITTLVPSEPSMYKMYMERGESAFRSGEYNRAFGEFELANDIGGNDDWMSLVSMTNSRFAASMYSYYSASFYAQKSLRSLPELPLLPLRPREFFGTNKNAYADGMVQLEARVEGFPYDTDAAFLLAFYRWFEPSPSQSQKALSRALAAARLAGSDEKVHAIEDFWRAMVSSGQVSGELTPAELPKLVESDSSSQPATAESEPATQKIDYAEAFWPTKPSTQPATQKIDHAEAFWPTKPPKSQPATSSKPSK